MTYLGMQIMVEGLALAAFGFIHQLTTEPLLKQLLRYVMSDEARHVAFGVLSLKEYYAELTRAEIRERQEFAFEAAVRMRDRFLQQEVWDRMGVPVKEAVSLVMMSPEQQMFQQLLFSKIVPELQEARPARRGADGQPGWLRQKFGELGVIQFEDWVDTGDEYESFAARPRAGLTSSQGRLALATCSDVPVPDEDRPFVDRVLGRARGRWPSGWRGTTRPSTGRATTRSGSAPRGTTPRATPPFLDWLELVDATTDLVEPRAGRALEQPQVVPARSGRPRRAMSCRPCSCPTGEVLDARAACSTTGAGPTRWSSRRCRSGPSARRRVHRDDAGGWAPAAATSATCSCSR